MTTHECNMCGNEMELVDNIYLKGFLIKGWRCRCGNEHSNPEDVDNMVRYFKQRKDAS